MKAWQRGYELDDLRRLAARFQDHDGPRPLGAFSKVKENTVADWLSANSGGSGGLTAQGDALIAWRWARRCQSAKDFTGRECATAPTGALIVQRTAGPAADLIAGISRLAEGAHDGQILWKAWADHPQEHAAAAALGMRRAGTAISASSEVRSIWVRSSVPVKRPLPAVEEAGILPLPALPAGDALELDAWPELVSELWADHYSSYNKRRSWHAVGLRSFGGDPAFIEKPAEMSKAWKAKNPATLHLPALDTPVMDALPGARRLLSSFPFQLERVRLMRLSAGGELARHADITDRDAGVQPGRIARLHLPIVTSSAVEFTSWDLLNRAVTTTMTPGCWWFLDVRKPHRAVNTGSADRVHLVVDAIVSPALLDILSEEAEARCSVTPCS